MRAYLPPGPHVPHEPDSVFQSRQLDPGPLLRLDDARQLEAEIMLLGLSARPHLESEHKRKVILLHENQAQGMLETGRLRFRQLVGNDLMQRECNLGRLFHLANSVSHGTPALEARARAQAPNRP